SDSLSSCETADDERINNNSKEMLRAMRGVLQRRWDNFGVSASFMQPFAVLGYFLGCAAVTWVGICVCRVVVWGRVGNPHRSSPEERANVWPTPSQCSRANPRTAH